MSLLDYGAGSSPLDFSFNKGEDSLLFKRFKGVIREKGLLGSASSVLVALSGGPDSVCLLHLFYLLARSKKINLQAAHLHHGLRGKEADRDAEFAKEICQTNSIRFHLAYEDVAKFAHERRMNLQGAARNLRYRFLKDVAQREGIKLIATGHTADDQAEELLLRFIRGSALEGLSGMHPKRGDGVIRPLLFAEKDEILKHLDAYKIPFIMDSSNLASKYTRNRLRQRLIPIIKRDFNPSIVSTLSKTAYLLQDDEEVLADLAYKALEGALVFPKTVSLREGFVILLIGALTKWKPAIQRRVIRLALEMVGVQRARILADHLLKLQHIIESDLPSGSYSIPGDFWAARIYNHLIIIRKGLFDKGQWKVDGDWLREINAPGIWELPSPLGSISINKIKNFEAEGKIRKLAGSSYPRPLYLDAKIAQFPMQLRLRRPGDRFRPFGAKDESKLKDFFINRNIPRVIRDFIPLIVKGQKIAAVCGIEVSHCFRVTGRSVLEICWEPSNLLKIMLSLSSK